jgi:hypothetical protein
MIAKARGKIKPHTKTKQSRLVCFLYTGRAIFAQRKGAVAKQPLQRCIQIGAQSAVLLLTGSAY